MGAIRLLGAFDKNTPAANAAGQEWWIDVTDDANWKNRHKEEILLTADADTGASTEQTGRTEDQVPTDPAESCRR